MFRVLALRQRETVSSTERKKVFSAERKKKTVFLSDEGLTLETLDFTICIGSTLTFLYFDLYLYSAYGAHYVY